MQRNLVMVSLAAVALAATACGDPAEGEWRSEEKSCNDLKRSEFDLDGDLMGDGRFVVDCYATTGNAAICKADVEAVEKKEDRYDLEIDYGFCDTMGTDLGKVEADCELRKDDDQLRCQFGPVTIDFERVD